MGNIHFINAMTKSNIFKWFLLWPVLPRYQEKIKQLSKLVSKQDTLNLSTCTEV